MKVFGYILITIAVLSAFGSLINRHETDWLVVVMSWTLRGLMFGGGLYLITNNKVETKEKVIENNSPLTIPMPIEEIISSKKDHSVASPPSITDKMEPKEVAKLIMYLVISTGDNLVHEEYLKHNDKISAQFEASLIFFLLALQEIKNTLPKFSPQIESYMFQYLFDFCFEMRLITRLEPNMPTFIDNRLEMYKADLYKAMDGHGWMMAQSIHAIYYEPLKPDIAIENCFINRKDLANDTPLPFMFSSDLIRWVEILLTSVKTITKKVSEDEKK